MSDWKERARALSNATWDAVKTANGGRVFLEEGTPSHLALEMAEHLGLAGKEIDALAAENARMREALEPFAKRAELFLETARPDLIMGDVTLGECRIARAALSPAQKGEV